MEGLCPPHHPDMRTAVEAVCERKFGPGGPFNQDTPGPWKDSRTVRSAAQVHDERFRECVALQAQYVYDTFGKFPATVPSIFVSMYLQAHHLDTAFYDEFFKPGAYLETHARHMERCIRTAELSAAACTKAVVPRKRYRGCESPPLRLLSDLQVKRARPAQLVVPVTQRLVA